MGIDNSFDLISSDRLLSSTLFMRSSGDNNTILIVEGNTDLRFFKPLVRSDKYLLQAGDIKRLNDSDGGNKNKVIETIKKANDEGRKGIVGIVDADFDHLNNVPLVENLYRTDTHDLESMLLKSEKTFKKVLYQYFKANHLISDSDISMIQNILLDTSKFIGYTLWCSNECKWMINFNNFPIEKCIDEKCNLNVKKVYKNFKNKSKHVIPSLKTIELELNHKISDEWDLWQVCRGKEMLRVLTMYIKHNTDTGTCRHINLRNQLILAFDNEDFMNTNLYSSMRDWELKNRDYSLFK